MKFLLTGIGGFAGSLIAQQLLKHNYKIIGVYRSEIPKKRLALIEHENCLLIQKDLSKSFEFNDKVDGIIHIAGKSAPNGVDMNEYICDNILATKNLISYAINSRIKKFINFSSVSVYGDITTDIVDEDTPIINPSAYGISKLSGELLLKDVKEEIASVSLRLSGILGNGEGECWLAKVASKIMNNQDVEYFNRDAFFNNVAHIADIARFIMEWFNDNYKSSDIVNFACTSPMKLQSVLKTLINIMGSKSQLIVKTSKANSFFISAKKLENEFKFVSSSTIDILNSFASEIMQLQREKYS